MDNNNDVNIMGDNDDNADTAARPEADDGEFPLIRADWKDLIAEVRRIADPVAVATITEALSEHSVKDSLNKAITMLAQRNELLVIADKEQDVFEFYD
ncbi:unnamed protein product [Heligmosomoides polygyrus]|uniref:MarR family transcriptional regulator n=1 Tax=Heligmosomoides polygyrus TaxID=6339 RepID=A0A183GFM0_HELPZ|nr:unnamed protein product [Heligmosomoides polygyrus]